jgi:hypothetical protein
MIYVEGALMSMRKYFLTQIRVVQLDWLREFHLVEEALTFHKFNLAVSTHLRVEIK